MSATAASTAAADAGSATGSNVTRVGGGGADGGGGGGGINSPPPPPPTVLIPGFLSMGDCWSSGELAARDGARAFLPTHPGPLSSHHDRAVEVFYQLVGGTADYGAAHAAECGHARYGRTYGGLYPEWSARRPVDLLGHSIGGVTARVLLDLLRRR